jgi:hypothetical protein
MRLLDFVERPLKKLMRLAGARRAKSMSCDIHIKGGTTAIGLSIAVISPSDVDSSLRTVNIEGIAHFT